MQILDSKTFCESVNIKPVTRERLVGETNISKELKKMERMSSELDDILHDEFDRVAETDLTDKKKCHGSMCYLMTYGIVFNPKESGNGNTILLISPSDRCIIGQDIYEPFTDKSMNLIKPNDRQIEILNDSGIDLRIESNPNTAAPTPKGMPPHSEMTLCASEKFFRGIVDCVNKVGNKKSPAMEAEYVIDEGGSACIYTDYLPSRYGDYADFSNKFLRNALSAVNEYVCGIFDRVADAAE